MEPLFPPKLNLVSLKPNRLLIARQKMEDSLEKKGLLHNKTQSIHDLELLPLVQEIILAKLHDGPFSIALHKNLVRILQYITLKQSVFPSLYTIPKKLLLENIHKEVFAISLKKAWYMLCDNYQEPVLHSLFKQKYIHASDKKDVQYKAKLQVILKNITVQGNWCMAFVNKVINQHIQLSEIDTVIGVPESKLHRDILLRLCSPPNILYILMHNTEQLLSFLCSKKESDPHLVSRCIRTILEYWHDNGFTVEQLQKGTAIDTMVADFRQLLPADENSQYWVLLGEKTQKIFRRWKIIHALEEYFNKWDAKDSRRKYFWKTYIHDIIDIQNFPKAEALAMLIDNHWYVEFGLTGNACYRYTVPQWQQHQFVEKHDRQKISKPDHLKKYPHNGTEAHQGNWESKFSKWVMRGALWR